jgi:phosphotransacetylase
MDLLNKLFDIARHRNRKIVLPEGDDGRIIAAAARLRKSPGLRASITFRLQG